MKSGAVITMLEEESGGGLVPLATFVRWPQGLSATAQLKSAVISFPVGMRIAIVEPQLTVLPHGRVGLRAEDERDVRRGSDASVPSLAVEHILHRVGDVPRDVASLQRFGDELLLAGSLSHAESFFSFALTAVNCDTASNGGRAVKPILSAALHNFATTTLRVADTDMCCQNCTRAHIQRALACAAAAAAVDVAYAKAHARAGAALAMMGKRRMSEWCAPVARRVDGGFAPRAIAAGDVAVARKYALFVVAAVTACPAVPEPRVSYPPAGDLKAAQAQATREKEKGNRLFGSNGEAQVEGAAAAYAAAVRCLAPIAAPLLLGRAECRKRLGRLPEALCDAAAAFAMLPEDDLAARTLQSLYLELKAGAGVEAGQPKEAQCGFCAEELPELCAPRRTHAIAAVPPPSRRARFGARRLRWKCVGCLSVYYCGAGCARKHWSAHRGACRDAKAASAAAAARPSSAAARSSSAA